MQIIPRRDGSVTVMGEGFVNLRMVFDGPWRIGNTDGYRPDRLNAYLLRLDDGLQVMVTPFWGSQWSRNTETLTEVLDYSVALGIECSPDPRYMADYSDLAKLIGPGLAKSTIENIFHPLFERTVMLRFDAGTDLSNPLRPIKEYWGQLEKCQFEIVEGEPGKDPTTPEESLPDFFGSF